MEISGAISIIIKILTFFGSFATVMFWFYWSIVAKKRGYCIAPILFGLHTLTFLFISNTGFLSPSTYLIWKDILTLHGLLLTAVTGYILAKGGGLRQWIGL